MKVAIATVQVPFITGGAEILTGMLRDELKKRDYEADIVTLPFKWYPAESLYNCMLSGRMLDLNEINGEKIDKVIAMKFPAFYVKHPNKTVWLMHQHRQAYEFWGTQYGDIQNWKNGLELRRMIWQNDTKYLSEANAIYTIAGNTTKRLQRYNCLESNVLYHPPLGWEKMYCESYGDTIFYPSRIDPMKRQRRIVEAARYVKSGVKFALAGTGTESEMNYLRDYIAQYNLTDRVTMLGFISEEEKRSWYAKCLGVYFGAFDEDYGYITLESFFSQKPIIVHKDAGGPLEFVADGENGFVISDNPKEIARCADELYEDRSNAERMGVRGLATLKEKNMDWDYVIKKLMED